MRRAVAALRSLSAFTFLIAQVVAQSPSPGKAPEKDTPIVVELFTSEGCSSCPPADLLLQKLDLRQPIPGAQLIVLSEHVTYWDHDGWKDPNSSPALTDRQGSYEGQLGEEDSFTPQFIVDGTAQFRLADPKRIEAVLLRAKDDAKIPVRLGEITFDPGSSSILRARIETGANSEKHNAAVYVAVALDRVESQVLRGENGGKHLVHVAVVQQLTKIGKLPRGKTFAQDVQLKIRAGTDPSNVRLIAFVQEPGPGKLLGAAQRKLTN